MTVSVKISALCEQEEWQRWEGSRETRHARWVLRTQHSLFSAKSATTSTHSPLCLTGASSQILPQIHITSLRYSTVMSISTFFAIPGPSDDQKTAAYPCRNLQLNELDQFRLPNCTPVPGSIRGVQWIVSVLLQTLRLVVDTAQKQMTHTDPKAVLYLSFIS